MNVVWDLKLISINFIYFCIFSACRLDESGNVLEFLLPVKEEANSEGETEGKQEEEEASHTKK
jgi:hypothetical protein